MVEIEQAIMADRRRLETEKDMEEDEKRKVEEHLLEKQNKLQKAQYA